ncbi:exodeoxyribonuclease VII large subunit [Marinilabiliaceae bacterium ANBcel2]|nr:exodeoxyribonuclease VII large subunit [Marinilabiliaceae bacterium ANBcel2]
MKNALTLRELNIKIKGELKSSFPGTIWVRGEIASLTESRAGHCYIDLVERDEASDNITAKARAIAWSYTYRMLKPYFQNSTGQKLTKGIKVMLNVSVEFQELYGLSLNIKDIDPAYTLGDLEQQRREVLKRLEKEGVINMNRELPLPIVSQRIAIISSPSAAGYEDFVHQLDSNEHGIKFYYKLFPAVMQGDQAVGSVVNAFGRVNSYVDLFDLVVLIRGGGASTDLLCFDDYNIASHIAQFPLPVITGIGHERDNSVADIVAHTSQKTPTAVAGFLITGAGSYLERINSAGADLKFKVFDYLSGERKRLNKLSYSFVPGINRLMHNRKYRLMQLAGQLPVKVNSFGERCKNQLKDYESTVNRLPGSVFKDERKRIGNFTSTFSSQISGIFKREKERLLFLDRNNKLNDPEVVLKKGFAITYKNGKVVKDSAELKSGDEITTRLRDGNVNSKIE